MKKKPKNKSVSMRWDYFSNSVTEEWRHGEMFYNQYYFRIDKSKVCPQNRPYSMMVWNGYDRFFVNFLTLDGAKKAAKLIKHG